MLKKVFLAAAASIILAGATVALAPAPADAGMMKGMFKCHKAAKAKYPGDHKMEKAYKKACKDHQKAYKKAHKKGLFKKKG